MSLLTTYPRRKKLSSAQMSSIKDFIKSGYDDRARYDQIPCPLCQSDRKVVLFKNDRYNLPVDVSVCKSCGLVYNALLMSKNDLEHFYSSTFYRGIYSGKSTDYEGRYQFDATIKFDPCGRYFANESFFRFIKTANLQFSNVCEIGAGGGWNLVPFIQDCVSAVGYEPNPELVALGKRHGIGMQQGFINEVDGVYDLVLLRHVLEHFDKPLEALAAIRKHAGRYIAIEVPGFVKKIPSIQNAHVTYFSLNTLKALMAKAGFVSIQIDYFRANDFILGIFEKTNEGAAGFKYSGKDELYKVLKIYFKNQPKNIVKYFMGVVR